MGYITFADRIFADNNSAKARRNTVAVANAALKKMSLKDKLAAAGWEAKKTPDGRTFYFHRRDKKSCWSAGGLVHMWIKVESKGKPYYYHSHTKERRWTKPEDMD